MVAILGLAIGTGTMQAVSLQSTTTTVALTCSTATGPSTATVVVKPSTTFTTGTVYIAVPSGLPSGWAISPTTQQPLVSSNTTGITYTFSLTGAPAGCVGFTPTSATTFNFKTSTTAIGTATNDLGVSLSSTATSTTSGLSAAPTGTIALTCSLNGATYIPGSATTISVSSTSSVGTPFTVDTTTSPYASWITLSSTSGGTATTSTPITFTVAPTPTAGGTPGCGGFAAGSGAHTTTINLTNAPAPVKSITVTVTVTAASGSPLSVSPSGTIALTCVLSGSTYTPYGTAQTVTVTSAASGGTPFTVDTTTVPYLPWITLSSNAGGTANSSGVTFTVAATPTVGPTAGCGGFAAGTTNTTTIHLSNSPAADKTITVTLNVIPPPASNLLVSPASVTVTCLYNAGGSVPQTATTVSVTSAATGGTSFTTAGSLPGWLTLNAASPVGTNVGATPVTFTANATTGQCGTGLVGTSKTTSIHLVNAPAQDKVIPVTLMIVGGSTLTLAPLGSTNLSYIKGSGAPVYVDVKVTASPSTFFAVDTTTLPAWLNVDLTTGTATATGKQLRFSSTSAADSLAPGNYSATVNLNVSSQQPAQLTITLQVNNKAPTLTVVEGTTRPINWQIGTSMPQFYITLVSSDSPISYSLSTGGTLAPSISPTSGLAYSFGTAIPVNFAPLALAAATPGITLTGTVTIVWGSLNSTTVVTFNVNVLAAGATLSSISPASLPTATAGQTFTVGLVGTGFVQSTDVTQKTTVGIVVNGQVVTDTNIAANVVNPSNILLTFTVPASPDSYLPFANGSATPVTIGVCNPSGSTCTVPTGTAALSIGSAPIIQAVTSASSFQQLTLPNVAPFDLLSIFGSNFCSSAGTGCGSNTILSQPPDATYRFYPLSLTPDVSPATIRNLSVTFLQSDQSTLIAQAPLLFATNNQINLVVPGGVSSHLGTIYVVVTFGPSGCSLCSSAPFALHALATNPGIFTVGSDGQGDGAILASPSWAAINANNPAGMKTAAGGTSDTVQVFMTGLGMPDGTQDNTSYTTGNRTWPTDCITTASYLASLPTGHPTLIDGAVIQSTVLTPGAMAPCLISPVGSDADLPTATVGLVAATVTYAGWVTDSVAGLYQVNLQLPLNSATAFTKIDGTTTTGITVPVQLPVVVTANGKASQGNVSIWVTPRLTVKDPDTHPTASPITTLTEHCIAGASCTAAFSSKPVVATGGAGTYTYAVTSGLLPDGLSLIAGKITGTPSANTAGLYTLTVTATDSSVPPVTGTVTFQLQVDGGLLVTSTPSTLSAIFGNPVTASFLATGGTSSYSYAFTPPATLPASMSLTSGAFATTALTPAGSYTVSVTATDSATPPLTGIGTLPVTINLAMSFTALSVTAPTHGTATVLTKVTTTGNFGTVTYLLDATSSALGFAIDNTATTNNGNISVAGVLAAIATPMSITVTATDSAPATGSSAAAVYTLSIPAVTVL
jgi:Putative Ig domain